MLTSLQLERALRWAAALHRGQERKGSGVPYVEHVMGVAMVVDRLGFPEDVVIAALLHDVVEDTEATFEQVEQAFGPQVAEIVRFCSERKTDDAGRKRPWLDRKREHVEQLGRAPLEARAVMLADKLHNLRSIQLDLVEKRDVWSKFNADRQQVAWYYQSVIDCCGRGEPRLERLAAECRGVIREIEQILDAPGAESVLPAEGH